MLANIEAGHLTDGEGSGRLNAYERSSPKRRPIRPLDIFKETLIGRTPFPEKGHAFNNQATEGLPLSPRKVGGDTLRPGHRLDHNQRRQGDHWRGHSGHPADGDHLARRGGGRGLIDAMLYILVVIFQRHR